MVVIFETEPKLTTAEVFNSPLSTTAAFILIAVLTSKIPEEAIFSSPKAGVVPLK